MSPNSVHTVVRKVVKKDVMFDDPSFEVCNHVDKTPMQTILFISQYKPRPAIMVVLYQIQ